MHTYEAVDRRINNVVRGLIEVGVRQGAHVGVLMETRPSALVAIAALSRLGAVAVLMPPDVDLADRGPARRRYRRSSPIPSNLEAARRLDMRVLVLGGGESRDLDLSDDADVVDMEKIDPDVVDLPGWYRPNPGLARDLAFVGFSSIGGELVARQITNYRWALSAFGTASAANLGRGDTVYCLTPLHHQSGLLVSLGGAVVGGSRIALSRGLRPGPVRAGDPPVRRDGGVVHLGDAARGHRRSVVLADRQPPGAAVHRFRHADRPVEARRRRVRAGPCRGVLRHHRRAGRAGQRRRAPSWAAKGRPLPGGGDVELAAYDAEDDLILEDDRGFVRRADTNEVGVLLAHPRGPVDPTASVKRGVFAPADTWVSTEYLFRRDEDGDYWLVDNRGSVIHTERGPVYASPINDAVGRLGAVDLAVTYGVDVGGHQLAVTALALRPGGSIPSADLSEALADLPVGNPPDIVHVVPEMKLSASYRPLISPLRAEGIPKPSRNAWYLDPDTNRYKRLTVAVRTEIAGAQQ